MDYVLIDFGSFSQLLKIDRKHGPCFLAKNDPKCMFFASGKIVENNLGVTMTETRSKVWVLKSMVFRQKRPKIDQFDWSRNNIKGVKIDENLHDINFDGYVNSL
jgi:hypothetical protein